MLKSNFTFWIIRNMSTKLQQLNTWLYVSIFNTVCQGNCQVLIIFLNKFGYLFPTEMLIQVDTYLFQDFRLIMLCCLGKNVLNILKFCIFICIAVHTINNFQLLEKWKQLFGWNLRKIIHKLWIFHLHLIVSSRIRNVRTVNQIFLKILESEFMY